MAMRVLNLTRPIIHLNGTPKSRLLEDLSDAYDKLNDLYAAMKKCTPNQRDYYIHADQEAFSKASKEHEDRLRLLDRIQEEIDDLSWNISTQ
jgi:hypothetical protein